jgi:hypothetical protein
MLRALVLSYTYTVTITCIFFCKIKRRNKFGAVYHYFMITMSTMRTIINNITINNNKKFVTLFVDLIQFMSCLIRAKSWTISFKVLCF